MYLASELAGIPDAAMEVTSCLPLVAEAVQYRHYAAHVALLETLCKTLPHLAKGLGKKVFKNHLSLFLDSIFYALVSYKISMLYFLINHDLTLNEH